MNHRPYPSALSRPATADGTANGRPSRDAIALRRRQEDRQTEPSARFFRYLEKCDPAQHQARFYALHVTPTLFGEWSLVREWGRIGSPGTVRELWFDTLEQAQTALARLEAKKRKRGYTLIDGDH